DRVGADDNGDRGRSAYTRPIGRLVAKRVQSLEAGPWCVNERSVSIYGERAVARPLRHLDAVLRISIRVEDAEVGAHVVDQYAVRPIDDHWQVEAGRIGPFMAGGRVRIGDHGRDGTLFEQQGLELQAWTHLHLWSA